MSSVEIAIIRRAREIISDPERWTQSAYARDKLGSAVSPGSNFACRWCAMGAITKAARELDAFPGDGAVDKLHALLPDTVSLSGVNDHEGHAAVLALFDKALAADAAS